MRSLPIITAIIILLVVGCSKSRKGRIETDFEEYVSEAYVNPKDFIGIKSIEMKDSTDFYGMADKAAKLSEVSISKMDSVVELFTSTLSNAPKSRVYTSKVQNALNAHIEHLEAHTLEIALCKVATIRLREMLDSVSSMNKYNKSYILKTEFKNNPEYVLYYAQNFAFTDSIVFSKEPFLDEDMPETMKQISLLIETIMSGSESILDHTARMESIISMLN